MDQLIDKVIEHKNYRQKIKQWCLINTIDEPKILNFST